MSTFLALVDTYIPESYKEAVLRDDTINWIASMKENKSVELS